MKYLSKEKLENKNVLLRCDFNVPVKNNKITDNSKIIKSLKTINYLLENNNRVIILSHFGRVKTEEDKKNNSLKLVYEELKKHLDLVFVENNENVEFYLNTSKSKCFLLENTRFTDVPEKRESKNDLDLAKYWATFGDVFVVDAFASLHRAHSSTAGIGTYLPTYLGFLVESELENLSVLVNNPEKPFIVIMGGAKVDDKIGIINDIVKRCDKLILTGGILNTFLKVMGKNIGKSLVSEDIDVLKNVEVLLNDYKDKLIYTDKFKVLSNDKVLEKSINEVLDKDIIYDNLIDEKLLSNASLIFFNGTCGKFEDEKYAEGTSKLLHDLAKCSAKVIIGGGDTVSSVTKYGLEKEYYYLSSGGGATLEYVSSTHLKAIDYLEKVSVENQ